MRAYPDELQRISAQTLAHYDRHAQSFWEGTRDHDVRQNIDALLRAVAVNAKPPFELLDLGCGPGRDLATFSAMGHRATGLDGSPQLAAMARAHSGCPVIEQDLLALDLPSNRFDGIFANAVLFHVPSVALAAVLAALHRAQKPGGVLFSSNPRGSGEEGWSGGRYGVFHDLAHWRCRMVTAGFDEVDHYYRPAGLPLEQQPWLASVWRKHDRG